MFISAKRYEREKQQLIGAGGRVTDLLLQQVSQGIFALDADNKVIPPVSASLSALLHRRDVLGVSFEKLLQPVVSKKLLALAGEHLERLRAAPWTAPLAALNPLDAVEVRLLQPDGSYAIAQYGFEFTAIDIPDEPARWLVRVTDKTTVLRQAQELDELRVQVKTQTEILQGILRHGRARFAAALQRTAAALAAINAILRQPAREPAAFRAKLERTIEEVDRIGRESTALRLDTLQAAAHRFEESLQELRERETLSGTDFLPLAVKLDELFTQFSMLRALTRPAEEAAAAAAEPAEAVSKPQMTDNGTEIIDIARLGAAAHAPPAQSAAKRSAPAGSLEYTLGELTDHVAEENGKSVMLVCHGLQDVPGSYQSTVKNIAIQMIRNAVLHGIESPEERERLGKPRHGALSLDFKAARDGSFEFRFQDDGRGIDPAVVRDTAIAKELISAEAAARLRDRQTIKLIFKAGYTTLPDAEGGVAHGSGLSFVRRYVHDAGGKIALASRIGLETRYKVSLPAVPAAEPAPG